MSTNASNINDSVNTQTSDNGFINQVPYNYGWKTNNKGVNVPVIPYVISILEPQSLDINEEKTLRRYLITFIEQWEWRKNIPLLIISNMSGKIGEVVNSIISDLKKEGTKNKSNNRDRYSFVKLIDQSELISQSQKNISDNNALPRQSIVNSNLTIVICPETRDPESEQWTPNFNYNFLNSYLDSNFHDSCENINSILHIKSNSISGVQKTSVYYYKNFKSSSYKTINSPSKLMRRLGIDINFRIIDKINRSAQKVKEQHNNDVLINNDYSIDNSGNPVKQLLGYSMFYQNMSNYYKMKMRSFINRFCISTLFFFIFNSLIIYINNMCISNLGVNTLQLMRYCTAENNESKLFDTVTSIFKIETKINTVLKTERENVINTENGTEKKTASEVMIKSKILTNLESLKKPCLDLYFLEISKAELICIVFLILAAITGSLFLVIIISCFVDYIYFHWHVKYHCLQTLSDCLKIQAYWRFVGITETVSSNKLLSEQDPGWLLPALNGIYSTIPLEARAQSSYKNNLENLNENWIKKSIEKYRDELKKNQWSLLGWLSRIGVILCSVLTIFFISFFGLSRFSEIEFLPRVFYALIATVIIPIIIAIVCFCLRRDSKIGGFLQNIIQWFKNDDVISVVFAISFIIWCLNGFFDLWRTSYYCSKAQDCILNSGYFFRNINEDFRMALILFTSFFAIYILYLQMHMFDKEHKIISQLLNSFKNASFTIHDMLTNDYTRNKLVRKHNHLRNQISEITSDKLRDCIINKSDISAVIDNIRSQTLPTTNKKSGVSIGEPIKKIFSWLGSIITFKWCRNILKRSHQEEFIKVLENELNKLADVKETKLYQQLEQRQPHDSDWSLDKEIEQKCQSVIQDLGQEYLIKRIDWLHDVKERNLKPPAK